MNDEDMERLYYLRGKYIALFSDREATIDTIVGMFFHVPGRMRIAFES